MQGGKTKKEVFGCQATAEGPPGLLTDLYEIGKKKGRRNDNDCRLFTTAMDDKRNTGENTSNHKYTSLLSPQANLL